MRKSIYLLLLTGLGVRGDGGTVALYNQGSITISVECYDNGALMELLDHSVPFNNIAQGQSDTQDVNLNDVVCKTTNLPSGSNQYVGVSFDASGNASLAYYDNYKMYSYLGLDPFSPES
jgi:hypothetical protein